MHVIVSPFSKTFDEIWLIYFVPDFLSSEIKVWQLVEIPIREKIEIAIVLDLTNKENLNIDKSKVKSIISIKNSNSLLKDYQVWLIKWIASYYFTNIHNSLTTFFPKNVRDKLEKDKLDISINKSDSKSINKTEVELSPAQQKVFEDIKTSKNNKVLLYWITWSWKTEIYIKLIEECISKWKQALLLIPEIILTSQISEKIEKAFPGEVVVINSSITEATKTKHWLSISSWQTKVIVWTRSALFYPFDNLWLIIIDEEHDNSYISDKAPRYKSIEVAEKISDSLNIKLLLASWTPSINSMFKAAKGKYHLVNLLEKYK